MKVEIFEDHYGALHVFPDSCSPKGWAEALEYLDTGWLDFFKDAYEIDEYDKSFSSLKEFLADAKASPEIFAREFLERLGESEWGDELWTRHSDVYVYE